MEHKHTFSGVPGKEIIVPISLSLSMDLLSVDVVSECPLTTAIILPAAGKIYYQRVERNLITKNIASMIELIKSFHSYEIFKVATSPHSCGISIIAQETPTTTFPLLSVAGKNRACTLLAGLTSTCL